MTKAKKRAVGLVPHAIAASRSERRTAAEWTATEHGWGCSRRRGRRRGLDFSAGDGFAMASIS
jgi:hypothetical protein